MKIANPANLIIIRNNKLLLAKRNEKECKFNNYWSIPGGGSNYDESIEETLHREIKEELGCKIKNYTYFKSYVFQLNTKLAVRAFYFYGDIIGKIKLNEELSEFKWFEINDKEIFKNKIAFNQKQVIKDFIKFWKNKHKNLKIKY
ncbi:MAG: NUDIX hydrolase [Candidatus Woesearchaeota archaeon]